MGGNIDTLTGRERECLRLVHRGYESKEIALQLGISADRVNKIIGRAKQKHGASRRAIAARILCDAEEATGLGPTHSIGGLPMGVAPDAALLPMDLTNSEGAQESSGHGEAEPTDAVQPFPSSPVKLILPLRTIGRPFNELSKRSTLITIALIALGAVVTAGAAASLLRTINWLLSNH